MGKAAACSNAEVRTTATSERSYNTPSRTLPANQAVQRLPAATVYAAFAGIGTAGTAIVGMVFFGESTSLGRVCSLAFILLGLIGLRVFSNTAG